MKSLTKKKLFDAWAYCDEEDKSTEFMIQYMQDFAGVDFDCVMNFLGKYTVQDRIKFHHDEVRHEKEVRLNNSKLESQQQ